MRRLLLTLPFALLPLASVQAGDHEHEHDHHHEEHGSLGAHDHGVARLNLVLDGKTLEIQLESPAMNLVGFEHEAKSAEDRAKVTAVRDQLGQVQKLFGIPSATGCTLSSQELESPLFEAEDAHAHDEHEAHEEHSEIHAHYRFDCTTPEALKALNLSELFGTFPATEKIQVQLIGPNGQQGLEITASTPELRF